jgi:hypothetical protein
MLVISVYRTPPTHDPNVGWVKRIPWAGKMVSIFENKFEIYNMIGKTPEY